MKIKKWRSQQLTVALIIPLVLGCYSEVQPSTSPSGDRMARQQLLGQKPTTSPPQNPSRRQKKALSFKLPDEGAPGNRVGAATRDSCTIDDKHFLTALVPGTNIGLTIAERPTFWFYVPYQPNTTTPLVFELKDDQDKQVTKNSFQLTGTPGIVSISLPKNLPPLSVNKKYRWFLSFTCNSANSSEISVNGVVKRVTLNANLQSQLQKATTPRDRIIVYADNGFWYDTLTELVKLRRQNPQDEELKADWEDLLKSSEVQLPNIAREPIVSCCQSQE